MGNEVYWNKILRDHEKDIHNLTNDVEKYRHEMEQYKLMLKNKPQNLVDVATNLKYHP